MIYSITQVIEIKFEKLQKLLQDCLSSLGFL